MSKVISIVNQKGGVGKTTTAINLSACLGKAGKKILLIDFDPQANTSSCIVSDNQVQKTCFDWLVNKDEFSNCIIKSAMKNVDLLPSRFEIGLFDLLTNNSTEVKEFSLKNEINKVRDKYDFIFIDCSPSLGILNKLALIASDSILIPIQTEEFSMSGITQLLAVIKYMQQELNPTLYVEGVLITMLDRRLTASTEMLMEISKTFGEYVYREVIPRDTMVSKSQIAKKSLLDFEPWSPASLAYNNVSKELLEKQKAK